MPKSRETCTECSRRRQKCDRNVPCGRCVKRGKASSCTREWPSDGTPRPARASRDRDQNRLSSAVSPTGIEQSPYPARNVSIVEETTQAGGEDEISTLDFMTWRPSQTTALRTSGNRNDLAQRIVSDQTEGTDHDQTSVNLLQLLLPNVELMLKLINFHEKKLLWYHGCFHGPTFNSQVEDRLRGQNASHDHVLKIQPNDLQWTALLFSVLAGSLTSASESLLVEWGFDKTESLQLCTQWYNAATTSLRLGNYTSDHNILGAQAVATLTMCAHTLGFSGDLHVHLGAAIRIAQSLNLHRIRPDSQIVDPDSSVELRQTVLRKETGRRLWSQLCIQDWFSIPLAEAHAIHRGHFTTKKPGNRDHLTMVSLPESVPTYVSYSNYLYEIAALIAELHARMVSLNTDYTRYQLVLDFDKRMRHLATAGRPHYFDVTVPMEESWPWFVPWARRSLTICFAHKIMMIHRAFLKRSFTNDAFSLTRRTCIAASKTILNEAKLGRAHDEPTIWIDNAFCIAAAITLAVDACHRQPTEHEFDAHRSLVGDCVNMLEKQANSTLAVRGVRLLQILLARSSKTSNATPTELDASRTAHVVFDANVTSAMPILNAVHRAGVSLDGPNGYQDSGSDVWTDPFQPQTDGTDIQNPQFIGFDDLFAELLPPQAGFSNAYLFEELLDLSLER